MLIFPQLAEEAILFKVGEWIVVSPKGKIKRYTDNDFNKKFVRDNLTLYNSLKRSYLAYLREGTGEDE